MITYNIHHFAYLANNEDNPARAKAAGRILGYLATKFKEQQDDELYAAFNPPNNIPPQPQNKLTLAKLLKVEITNPLRYLIP